MKKTRILIFLLLAAFAAGVFYGCTAGTSSVFRGIRVASITSQSSDHVYLSCEMFNGGVTYTINVNETHQLRIDCDVTVNSGVLILTVEDDEGSTLFTEAIEGGFPFGIELPHYGTYRIIIEAEEFGGEYRLSWAR